MIKHKTTFYDDLTTIKTFSEFNGNVLTMFEEFDTNGLIIKRNVIGDHTETFSYDKKNRVIRKHKVFDDNTSIEWMLYTYGKDKLTIKHRLKGNPPVIHKMILKKDEDDDYFLLKKSVIL
jgi:hypothetical protein